MVPHPHDYHYIDEEGLAYNEEERIAMGAEANVSHGQCPTCGAVQKVRDDAVMDSRRASERAIAAAADETNRDVGQTTGAYIPIPEAHQPIPEAHTPVSEQTSQE